MILVFIFQVMRHLAVSTAITVGILLVVSSTVICVSRSPSATLCEARCETATPYLVTLKTLWHRMSKRIGKESKSLHGQNFVVIISKQGKEEKDRK